jgi:hypothetical protein
MPYEQLAAIVPMLEDTLIWFQYLSVRGFSRSIEKNDASFAEEQLNLLQ